MRRRKWLAAFGIVVLLLVVAIVTAPRWAIHALGPLAKLNGIQYDRMEQISGGRLAFHNINGAKGDATFYAEYLETPSLQALWDIRKGAAIAGQSNHVVMRNWIVSVKPKAATKKGAEDEGLEDISEIFEQIEEGAKRLHKTFSSAQLANGKLNIGDREFTLGNVQWENNELTADLSWPGLVGPADVRATLPVDGPYGFSFRVNPLEVSLRATVVREGNRWWLASTNVYQGNRFRAEALFDDDGVLPIEGSLTGKNLKFPGRTFGLNQFAQVSGTLDLQLQKDSYTLKSVVALHREEPDAFPSIDDAESDATPTVRANITAQGAKTLAAAQAATVTAGEIKFPETTFKVHSGTITPRFNVSFFPTVDLQSVANAFQREITLRVVGPAHKPDVQYRSTPAMPPGEIERMLTEGKTAGVTVGAAQ